jgi:hypothetical protein
MTVRTLLVTTNGAGMGHLARMTAVALAGEGTLDSTILTFSSAASLTGDVGVPVEYCPSRDRGWHSHWLWDDYMQRRLVTLAKELRTQVVVFDGVVPYDGLLLASTQLPEVTFVWSRRGMWKAEAPKWPLRRSRLFDAVVEPSDIAGTADSGATAAASDAQRIPPVTLLSETPMLSREEARVTLGLPTQGKFLYVTVGSLIRTDVALLGAIDAVALKRGYTIVTAGAIPGATERGWLSFPRCFPLVQQLHAFNAVVCAAGYNAVHESVAAGIPTLLLPDLSPLTDDQAARAAECVRRGLALTAPAADHAAVAAQLEALLGNFQPTAVGDDLSGARAMVNVIAALADAPRKRSLRARRIALKRSLLRAFGPTFGPVLRKLLSRRPVKGPSGKLNLGLGEQARPVVWASDVAEIAQSNAAAVVEHVLPGTSAVYAQARRRIAAEFFVSRM